MARQSSFWLLEYIKRDVNICEVKLHRHIKSFGRIGKTVNVGDKTIKVIGHQSSNNDGIDAIIKQGEELIDSFGK